MQRNDNREHAAAIEYMLRTMLPPEPYRAALEAARVSLLREDTAHSAAKRTANDWPYCPKCGAPYVGLPTESAEVRNIVPACSCHRAPVWGARPAANDWIVTVQEPNDNAIGRLAKLMGPIAGKAGIGA